MKSFKITLLLVFVFYSALDASDVKTNATILKDQTVFTIKSKEEAVVKYDYAAIIHNKYATKAKQITIYYDDFVDVKNAEVSIHSMDGKRINRIKLKDFEDHGIGLSSTASDGRIKFYEPTFSSYPFIIKVSYELHKSGSLHYPVWRPQEEENLEVKSASFIVEDYSGNGFQFKSYQLKEPKIKTIDGAKIYKWKIEDLQPFEFEAYNYSWEDYAPVLYTSPKNFEMDGIEGDMSTWKSFGQWIAKLNAEKKDISSLDFTDLDKRIESASSEEEKIRLVYEYLQTNTRYVSIQLGIGGWQPFAASFVHEKKYGDCKALSNYTQVLLERYGINSYYTLIKSGNYPTEIKEDFPNAHFNHAIVTVPIENDTIFLECTSQTNPFGYMGKFTSDRNALMITPEGGKLIGTKKYLAKENLQNTTIDIDLTKEKNSTVTFERDYTGLEIENHHFDRLYHKESKDIDKWIRENHDWGGQKIQLIELKELTQQQVPEAGYTVEFTSNSEYVEMGNRKFISADRYVDSFLWSLPNRKRNTSIKIKYGYTQNDTIRYHLDKYHLLEKDLTKMNFTSVYGDYYRELQNDGDEILYIRKFKLSDGEYSGEECQGFKDFVQKVKTADKERFVLLDKT